DADQSNWKHELVTGLVDAARREAETSAFANLPHLVALARSIDSELLKIEALTAIAREAVRRGLREPAARLLQQACRVTDSLYVARHCLIAVAIELDTLGHAGEARNVLARALGMDPIQRDGTTTLGLLGIASVRAGGPETLLSAAENQLETNFEV